MTVQAAMASPLAPTISPTMKGAVTIAMPKPRTTSSASSLASRPNQFNLSQDGTGASIARTDDVNHSAISAFWSAMNKMYSALTSAQTRGQKVNSSAAHSSGQVSAGGVIRNQGPIREMVEGGRSVWGAAT